VIEKLILTHHDELERLKGCVDVLAGGPPRQGFSTAGGAVTKILTIGSRPIVAKILDIDPRLQPTGNNSARLEKQQMAITSSSAPARIPAVGWRGPNSAKPANYTICRRCELSMHLDGKIRLHSAL
jgi:hypothetical protein